MQDKPDGFFATFKAEWEQTKWLLRYAAVGAVFVVTWSWVGSLFLSAIIVGAVNLLAVLLYGSGIAVLVIRIMYAAKRWQIEPLERAEPLAVSKSLMRAASDGRPLQKASTSNDAEGIVSQSTTATPKSNFHKVHFMLRLQEEVENARREGSEIGVAWLDVTLPGRGSADLEAEKLAADVANLLAGQAKTIGQPLNINQNQYVLSLPGQGRASATAFVSKLVQAMGNYWCNCGIAIYPKDGTSAQALYDEARRICEGSGRRGSEAEDLPRAA